MRHTLVLPAQEVEIEQAQDASLELESGLGVMVGVEVSMGRLALQSESFKRRSMERW